MPERRVRFPAGVRHGFLLPVVPAMAQEFEDAQVAENL
jgi:hypothetical protein